MNGPDNFKLASDVIDIINNRLNNYSNRLRELQPIKEGSIQLELHNCGKGCRGCPHAKWKKWGGRKRGGTKPLWLAFKIEHPERSLKKKGEFEEVYEESLEVIQEAKYLIKMKKDLMVEHRKIGSMMRRIR